MFQTNEPILYDVPATLHKWQSPEKKRSGESLGSMQIWDVSCFSLDEGATDWPTAAPATTNPTKIATLLLLPSLSQATVPLITGSTSAVAQRSLQ
jgi:hypothetical protein